MNLERRLDVEQQLLHKYFKHSFLIQNRASPYLFVTGTLRTNSGAEYGLWIPMTGFPDAAPMTFIVSPVLRGADGRKLPECSIAMHTLERHREGHVAPCLYRPEDWTPTTTLYKVVMKARVWLEGYEAHVRTARPIDAFLPHVA